MQAKRALIGTLLTPFWFSVCELSLRKLTSRRVRRVDKLLVMKLTGRRIRRVNKLLVIKDKLVLMLPCLWNKQLVYSSTRSLVYLPCYSVFLHKQLVYLSNLFTRLLVTLPHTPRIGSIFSASLRRIIVFFSAKTWHYSKKVVSLLH